MNPCSLHQNFAPTALSMVSPGNSGNKAVGFDSSKVSIPFESRKFPHLRAVFQATLRGIDAHSLEPAKSTYYLCVHSPGNFLVKSHKVPTFMSVTAHFPLISPVHPSYTFHAPISVCPTVEAPSRFLKNI